MATKKKPTKSKTKQIAAKKKKNTTAKDLPKGAVRKAANAIERRRKLLQSI